jgi:hypothetical protein
LAVDSEGYKAEGQELVSALQIEGLHSEIGLSGLRRGVWEIRNTRLRRLTMHLDATYPQATAPMAVIAPDLEPPSQPSIRKTWLPDELELQSLELDEWNVHTRLTSGDFSATGMRLIAVPDKGKRSFQAEIRNGTIRTPFEVLPSIQLIETRLRAGQDSVFLSKLSANAWSKGRIDATGEWHRETNTYSFGGTISDVNSEDLLNETWAKRITGTLSTDFSISNTTGKPSAHGHLILTDGVLTALPVLDALAAYADTRRLRVLNLNEAHTKWRWTPDELTFHHIVIGSEGTARVEGQLQIRSGNLDGTLQLGLVPGTLASLPGAETHVFTRNERGLLWATIHVSGTLEKPRENLSERLLAAAGLRMLETLPENGEKVIKFTRNVLGEDSARAVEKGVEIIDKSGLNIEDVGGILNNILGGGRRHKNDDPE